MAKKGTYLTPRPITKGTITTAGGSGEGNGR